MENCPVVSVSVISYNSSPYIIETLESIKRQTYNRIELIISDDASTDDTVNICKEWLSKNSSCFHRALLVESNKNTGVSGNANRALKKVTGEWLKLIAADDCLADNAIDNYLSFCSQNPNVDAVFSDYISFWDVEDGHREFKKNELMYKNVFFGSKVSSRKQYHILLKNFIGFGPTLFIRTNLLKAIGFDERFPMQEDYALFIALTKNGHKLYRLPEYLVYYRENPLSITKQISDNQFFGNSHCRVIMEYKCMYRYENMGVFWKIMMRFSLFLNRMVFKTGNRKNSFLCSFFYYSQRVLDPFRWYTLGLKIADKIM